MGDDLELNLILCGLPLGLHSFAGISVPLLLLLLRLVIIECARLVIPLCFSLLAALLGVGIKIDNVPAIPPFASSSCLGASLNCQIHCEFTKNFASECCGEGQQRGEVIDSVQTLNALDDSSNLTMAFFMELDSLMAARMC